MQHRAADCGRSRGEFMMKYRPSITSVMKSYGRLSTSARSMRTSDSLSLPADGRPGHIAPGNLATLLSLFLILLAGILLSNAGHSLAGNPARPKKSPLVDINHASVEEIATLPGIGKVIARRIIEFREKNGPFRRPEELLIIRGISEKRLKQILPLITLGPDPERPGRKK
jgi:competence ComEA-like helix-hairpin-helix protein